MKPARAPSFAKGDKGTLKYLSQHAEPESQAAESASLGPEVFGHGLAIPAQAEDQTLLESLSTIPASPCEPTLIVVVVNAASDASKDVLDSNARCLEELASQHGAARPITPDITAYEHTVGQLIVIDRSSVHRLPARQGVGLARKIGCDFLLKATQCGRITSPWIHCSDADTRLPPNYFEQASIQAQASSSALLYPFRHRADNPDAATNQIALEYEISLRYYVLGLRFAGSPHAYHSIGSAMAVHANAYAQVRGFPRREAAEDFYLLSKLAKLGPIQQLSGSPIEPSSRSSSRVPFGTGAAIKKALESPPQETQVYHPLVFEYLRSWQASIADALTQPTLAQDLRLAVAARAKATPRIGVDRLLQALDESKSLSRAQSAFKAPASMVARRIQDSLDAFRTLKLVHCLRDTGLQNLGLREALDQAPFIKIGQEACALDIKQIATVLEHLDDA